MQREIPMPIAKITDMSAHTPMMAQYQRVISKPPRTWG